MPEISAQGSIYGWEWVIGTNRLEAYVVYVRIPSDHPLFGINYNQINGIYPHGGLTFSGIGSALTINLSPKGWYIGWDYAHAGDFIPGYPPGFEMTGGKHWTLEEVFEEDVLEVIASLSAQTFSIELKELAPPDEDEE